MTGNRSRTTDDLPTVSFFTAGVSHIIQIKLVYGFPFHTPRISPFHGIFGLRSSALQRRINLWRMVSPPRKTLANRALAVDDYGLTSAEPIGRETCRRAFRPRDLSTSSGRVAQGRLAQVESLKAEWLRSSRSGPNGSVDAHP
jgi:hypothetical protein